MTAFVGHSGAGVHNSRYPRFYDPQEEIESDKQNISKVSLKSLRKIFLWLVKM